MVSVFEQPWRRLDLELVRQIAPTSGDAEAIISEVTAAARASSIIEPDDATLANLGPTAYAGLAEFLREAGHPERPANREVFLAHGRAQHLAGRSVQEMLSLYQAVSLAYWRRVADNMLKADLPIDLVLEVSESIYAYVSDLANFAAEGFIAAGTEEARGWQTRRDQLIEQLLGQPWQGSDEVALVALAAGWRLPKRAAVAVVSGGLDAHGLLTPPTGVLSGRFGEAWVIITPEALTTTTKGWLPQAAGDGHAGLGPFVEVADIRTSYDRANALLHLAQRRAAGPGSVLELDDNELDLLVLGDEELAQLLADTVLAPLLAMPSSRRTPLIRTLGAWISRPDQPLAIAADLHIHVQTVRYRVRQLRALLGDAVDDPASRARLAIAVRAYELRGPRSSG